MYRSTAPMTAIVPEYVIADTVPVTVGARSGLTAGPGDVAETVIHFRGKDTGGKDPKVQAIADGLPFLQSLSAITWRGHNPTVFKVQQVCVWVCRDCLALAVARGGRYRSAVAMSSTARLSASS